MQYKTSKINNSNINSHGTVGSKKFALCLTELQEIGKNKTNPADCRKIAAVDSNKHDWDWKNRRYWKKKIFVQKHFLSPIYFDGIS